MHKIFAYLNIFPMNRLNIYFLNIFINKHHLIHKFLGNRFGTEIIQKTCKSKYVQVRRTLCTYVPPPRCSSSFIYFRLQQDRVTLCQPQSVLGNFVHLQMVIYKVLTHHFTLACGVLCYTSLNLIEFQAHMCANFILPMYQHILCITSFKILFCSK